MRPLLVFKLYYVHDPMCSWCWAFRPIYLQLLQQLPKEIKLIRLLGGLAPDSTVPMSDDIKNFVISQWRKIENEVPNIQFNYDFWTNCNPRRSTYPACRAVIAARLQGDHFDELMTHAIQRAYYLEARNPSDNEILIDLAEQIGCNKIKFIDALDANQTSTILSEEIAIARKLQLNSLPSLLFQSDKTRRHISSNYKNVDAIISSINSTMHIN